MSKERTRSGRPRQSEGVRAFKRGLDVLHEAALTVAGHRLVNLRHELSDAARTNDGETYHGIIRFRAVLEPV